MDWPEVFAVFVICHLVGDFLLQTNGQATRKFGGLSSNGEAFRALGSHTISYTLAFVPALIWLAPEIGAWVIPLAVLIGFTHMLQDDGRLLDAYMRSVKGVSENSPPGLRLAVDQTLHLVVLFGLALLVVA